jgi:riboflavin biosynthesis pyrimidine reductase
VELRKKYHGQEQGLPYWVILDRNGNLLADSRLKSGNSAVAGTNVGCPSGNEEVNYFTDVIKKTSTLDEKQLVLIRDRFLKNKE